MHFWNTLTLRYFKFGRLSVSNAEHPLNALDPTLSSELISTFFNAKQFWKAYAFNVVTAPRCTVSTVELLWNIVATFYSESKFTYLIALQFVNGVTIVVTRGIDTYSRAEHEANILVDALTIAGNYTLVKA